MRKNNIANATATSTATPTPTTTPTTTSTEAMPTVNAIAENIRRMSGYNVCIYNPVAMATIY